MRRLKKKGKQFMEHLGNWKEGQLFYRKLIAIPLLPAADINEAFDWLLANTVAEVLNDFTDLIAYFRSWWLQRVTPIKLTVFMLEDITNNGIEAYHRNLRKKFGSHPSLWQLTSKA